MDNVILYNVFEDKEVHFGFLCLFLSYKQRIFMNEGVSMSNIKRLCMLPNNEFLSYQPYLELNTKYQSYIPIERNPIRDIVWEVYEVDDFDLEKTIALPDVCADIMTFYTKDNAFGYFMGGSISLQQMRELEFMKDVNSIFGVRLRTGMLGNLFRCDVKDINDSRIAMSDALWNGREIEERMMKADNFIERWEIMSNYLEQRVERNYKINNIVSYSVKKIIESKGCITIKELEEDTGYTGRYLRKLVKEHLGISIKQFCEITKFQWMCNYYRLSEGDVSLSELALQAGYYDQSHMNLSCKKLTGELPKKIITMYA